MGYRIYTISSRAKLISESEISCTQALIMLLAFNMGLVYANISLSNPRNPKLKPVEVKALADTGALHLCIPQHIALQLELESIEQREVTTADGKKHLVPYVGPIQISFENRSCFTGALILGDEPLLGAVPMEDMDILVSPARQTVIVNPESPNIPLSVAKAA